MRLSVALIAPSALAILAAVSTAPMAQDAVRPVPGHTQGHAHNDYLHERPLLDALEAGMGSVEADVFLVDDQLLVAHTAQEITPERSLQKLYLDPLRARVAAGGGQVYPTSRRQSRPFYLLIDIKSDALATYRQLHPLLADYADLWTRVEAGQVTEGPIQVVISGNRPQEFIAAQPKRFCGIDGRVSDLESAQPAHLMPMISDNWGLLFAWRGKGPIPAAEHQQLEKIVRGAHEKGRTVRFWGTPENKDLWQVLLDARVDWINTDQLDELSKFLEASSSNPPLTKVWFQVDGHSAFVIAAPKPASGQPSRRFGQI